MKVFLNIILSIGLIMSLGFLALEQRPTEMIIAFLGWTFLLFFWNLEKFEYMKVGQIEAKSRQLNKIVDEAKVTLQNLKEVASPNINYIFLFLADGNRYGRVCAAEQDTTFRELYALAVDLDIKNEEYIRRAFYGVINKYRIEIQTEYKVSAGLDFEIKNRENLESYFTRIEDSWSIKDQEEYIEACKVLKSMKKLKKDFYYLI